jgi:hypothetical protein
MAKIIQGHLDFVIRHKTIVASKNTHASISNELEKSASLFKSVKFTLINKFIHLNLPIIETINKAKSPA